MGSGGRELGRKLAERLGIEYYDKQLLLDAAKKSGMIPEIFERDDEREPSILSRNMPFGFMGAGSGHFFGCHYNSNDAVYSAQSDIIRELGETKSCVIVGRTADYVLRNHPRCINIFVHAPESECVKRLLNRGDKPSESEARTMCRKINKLRASYYNFYTDRTWGAAANYDLTINSAQMPMDDLADFIAEYVRRRLQ